MFYLAYDAENRLVSVTGSNLNAAFEYDGDGKQVKSIINGSTSLFIGLHYQVVAGTVTKYYFAGASRIAMRVNTTLYYLLSDHLGSTNIATDSSGNLVSELRYKAWGETRYAAGATPTSYRYTGQREESSFGLYFYNARWYDPASGRFAQADSIVPGGVQGFDRYAYVSNNPVRYNDPTGHYEDEGCGSGNLCELLPEEESSGNGNDDSDGVDENNLPSSTTTTNYWPDYWILSGIVPLCPIGLPICGPAVSITVDRYLNVYVAGGFGIGLPATWSLGGGWFLAPNNDNQEFAENFLKGHSFTVSGGGSELGVGPGIGVNNNNPSYSAINHEGTTIENIAVEALITTTGVDVSGTYGILLYDNGDPTPWIWQDD